MQHIPVLWSFRRCPYAMRARLAIRYSGQPVVLREILLRDKPAEFLATSAKGTVPVLDTDTGVIAESYDIMCWALDRCDPDGWRDMPDTGHDLIAQSDSSFKSALDLYKYHDRHPAGTRKAAQDNGAIFLHHLNDLLRGGDWLFSKQSLADMAILPFVRQFANTDKAWFDAQNWPDLLRWLAAFTQSTAFSQVMVKYPPWQPDQDRVLFGCP